MNLSMTRTALKFVAQKFSKDESGATAIEYALFAALIGAAIVGGITGLGNETNTTMSTIKGSLETANGTTSDG